MDKINFISQSTSLTLVIAISLIFTLLGLVYSKKYQGLNNYLTANRNVGFFSLSTSLVASALGAWILFGPASAATWGGYRSCYWLRTRNSLSYDFFNIFRKKNKK